MGVNYIAEIVLSFKCEAKGGEYLGTSISQFLLQLLDQFSAFASR
jgi:hypothetical protein